MSQELEQESPYRALKNDEDLQAILRLAVQKEHEEGASLRERLALSAAELNISPQALEEAAKQYAAEKEEKRALAEQRKAATTAFVSHIATYIAVNLFLFMMDGMQDRSIDWAYWVLFGWGIGIATHFIKVYIQKDYTVDED